MNLLYKLYIQVQDSAAIDSMKIPEQSVDAEPQNWFQVLFPVLSLGMIILILLVFFLLLRGNSRRRKSSYRRSFKR